MRLWILGDETLQRLRLGGIRGTRARVGLEQGKVAAGHVATHAGLEVDRQLLERDARGDRLL